MTDPKKRRRKNRYTPEYIAYLETPEWRDRRAETLLRDGGKCTKCESEAELHCHHLTYKNLFAEEPEDLTTLCYICHMKAHGRKPRKKKQSQRPDMVYAGRGCWVPKGMSLDSIQKNMAKAGGRKNKKRRR